MAQGNIHRIAVIGAESTGKTALCEALATHYKTVWVPEFAREYFNDSDIYNYSLDDLVNIAQQQLSLERNLESIANRFLFCDTTLITLKIWAELEFDKVPGFIQENLQSQYYTHFFITDNSIPWAADGLRQNKFSRDLLLEMNINEVKKVNGSFSIISGNDRSRTQQAINVIDSFHW